VGEPNTKKPAALKRAFFCHKFINNYKKNPLSAARGFNFLLESLLGLTH